MIHENCIFKLVNSQSIDEIGLSQTVSSKTLVRFCLTFFDELLLSPRPENWYFPSPFTMSSVVLNILHQQMQIFSEHLNVIHWECQRENTHVCAHAHTHTHIHRS